MTHEVIGTNKLARQKLRDKYEFDLYGFTTDVLGYGAPHEPLHKEIICPFLTNWEDGKDVKVMLIPRAHLKSTFCSVALPLWTWGLDPLKHPGLDCGPETRFLQGHAKLKDAKGFLTEAKHHLVNNEMFRWGWPHIMYDNFERESPTWTKEEYKIKREDPGRSPSMVATGVGAQPVGFHFHYFLGDDLVHPDNLSVNGRADVLTYFKQCQALLIGEARTIIPGTRWHLDDMYSLLIDKDGEFRDAVQSLVLKSGFADGNPIFPVSEKVPHCGFNMKRLQKKLSIMSTYQFMCQYENDPRPDDANAFSEKDMNRFELDYNGDIPTTKNIHFVTAVDPNRSEDEANDPFAVVTAAIDEDGEIWVVDITSGHMRVADLKHVVHAHYEKWNPQQIIIETTGVGLPVFKEVQRHQVKMKVRYPLIEAKRGPRSKKIERIRSMIPLVERNGLFVRRGKDFDELVQQLVNLTISKHDDMADALADIYHFGSTPPPKRRILRAEAPRGQFAMSNLLDGMTDARTTSRRTRRA